MGSLSIRGGRDEHGMAGPEPIDGIESSIVLCNDKHFILVVLPGNANQPVVKKRQVRLAHGADDHGLVLGDEGRCFSERVVVIL